MVNIEKYETPIHKLNLKSNNNVYIKRDDLLPFSFGGNKVRIAYEYFNDLIKKKFNCIIGYGSVRSNLCRAISNLSVTYKIPCYIISPIDNDEVLHTYNAAITTGCGAKVIECKKSNVSATISNVIDKCKKNGLNPYYINGDIYGKGNEALPVNAYVKTYNEILKQSKQLELDFDMIFLAVGTGMTYSGLLAGKRIYGGDSKIIGISIARTADVEIPIVELYLKEYYKNTNILPKTQDNICILDNYLCGGYAKNNRDIIKLINNIMLTDGVPLDITYTGKAMYGMMSFLEKNNIKDKNVLFIHTGGTPLFFDDISLIFT